MRNLISTLLPTVTSSGFALGLTAAASTALAFTRPAVVHAPAEPLHAAGASRSSAVVVRAGTIHAVEGGATFENGVIVVMDGKIQAVGSASDVSIPAGATTVDYGSEAVIIPGLIAVDSSYARPTPGPRTADPSLLAIDQFDPYSNIVSALKNGITTVYLAPARGRLIAGQGAVVKSGGGEMGDAEERILRETAGIHGSISEEARRTPGYWEPPVPATVDVGLGVEAPQLPRTTMGAVLAIEELMAFAGGDKSYAEEYGAQTGPALAKLLKEGTTWRLGAETPGEVRAVLDVAKRFGFPLVIDGAGRAASLAEAIAEARVPVIARPHFQRGRDVGKSETAAWPDYEGIARLVGEGVQVAIAVPPGLGVSELRFAAALAMRGGLSEADALAGITLNAARVLGVEGRVGSLAKGKDADMVVLTGAPMATATSVVATYIGGSEVWNPAMASAMSSATSSGSNASGARHAGAAGSRSMVISVDHLHVGNGEVHSPGEILVRDGKIAQVAAQVGRPTGATVVRGAAAMPGMIDAYGHLGTEGGRRSFSTRLDLSRLLEPGDFADRQVALNGVTTVNMISQNLGGATPSIAYKPAAMSFDDLVVDPVASLRMDWDNDIVTQSGENIRQQLRKAREYVDSWDKYEAEMAEWVPPADESDADEVEKAEDKDEEKAEDEDKDKDDKKKKKKERDPAKAVTGVFEGTFAPLDGGDGAEPGKVRFRFLESADGSIEGTVRMAGYDDLLSVTGSRTEYDVSLVIETPDGDLQASLTETYSNDPEPKGSKKKSKKDDGDKDEDKDDEKEGDKDDDKEAAKEEDDGVKTFLRGEVKRGEDVVGQLDTTQVSDEYKVARRVIKVPEKEDRKRSPKGQPKEPSIDPDLEPIRRAMSGEAAILVKVTRDDQILACVETFEEYGIQPVLVDSDDVHKVADQIAGRVAGVLIPMNKMIVTEQNGYQRNRMVEVSSAGIPVAFLSEGEEGAAELGVMAARAMAQGLAPVAAFKGLTSDAAKMLRIDDRVGTLAPGMDADILILDGSPLEISSSVKRVFVAGKEIH
ncbi:imidazolonepropionase [Planctomycetes bacterium Poly30]|uniref:Imidazolonepropionase n=1 Tax=Saltatorellus ferox TaxID=2528018 RepID=A0A518EYE4_9BACT|nr:imidazolonepropionase [Planctomycetes bacterium Poly30]